MASRRELIAQTLDLLTTGLFPYVESELRQTYGDRWHDVALESFRNDRTASGPRGDVIRWDAHALLTVMWDQWNKVFRQKLGLAERSLVAELRDYRNRWAHQTQFTFDDAYRVLDSAERLLRAIGVAEADRAQREKQELMRAHFNQEARSAYKKARIRRRKMKDFIVYSLCCGSIVFSILNFFGPDAWFLVLFVVAVFIYLAWQRLIAPLPFYFGPHECLNCNRIIYGEDCPYCEKIPSVDQGGEPGSNRDGNSDSEYRLPESVRPGSVEQPGETPQTAASAAGTLSASAEAAP